MKPRTQLFLSVTNHFIVTQPFSFMLASTSSHNSVIFSHVKTKKSWKHRLSIFFIFELYVKPASHDHLCVSRKKFLVWRTGGESPTMFDSWWYWLHLNFGKKYLIYFISICFFFCQHHHLVDKIGHRVFITYGILEYSGLPMMIRWRNTTRTNIRRIT